MPKISMFPNRNIDVSSHRHPPERCISSGRRALRLFGAGTLCITLLLLGSGCQYFCCGTNAWSSMIDCGPDHAVPFDWCYCPKLDLTRIGRPCGLPGRSCCRCSTECCNPGAVYAHRWNSPPPPVAAAPSGLQGIPDFPAAEPGPYFPPSTDPDQATPLFESAEQPMARVHRVPQDQGVVRTHFTRVSETQPEPEPARQPHSTWLVPVDAIFAN